MERRTLEIWGDLKTQNQMLLWVVGALSVALVAVALAVWGGLKRTPYLIRVNASGEAQVLRGTPEETAPDLAEARFFARQFLSVYLAPAPESAADDMALVLAWMTPKLREAHRKVLEDVRFISKVKSLKAQARVFFGDVVAAPTGARVTVTTEGMVESRLAASAQARREPFSATILLAGAARSTWNPNGFLVDHATVTYGSGEGGKGDDGP